MLDNILLTKETNVYIPVTLDTVDSVEYGYTKTPSTVDLSIVTTRSEWFTFVFTKKSFSFYFKNTDLTCHYYNAEFKQWLNTTEETHPATHVFFIPRSDLLPKENRNLRKEKEKKKRKQRQKEEDDEYLPDEEQSQGKTSKTSKTSKRKKQKKQKTQGKPMGLNRYPTLSQPLTVHQIYLLKILEVNDYSQYGVNQLRFLGVDTTHLKLNSDGVPVDDKKYRRYTKEEQAIEFRQVWTNSEDLYKALNLVEEEENKKELAFPVPKEYKSFEEFYEAKPLTKRNVCKHLKQETITAANRSLLTKEIATKFVTKAIERSLKWSDQIVARHNEDSGDGQLFRLVFERSSPTWQKKNNNLYYTDAKKMILANGTEVLKRYRPAQRNQAMGSIIYRPLCQMLTRARWAYEICATPVGGHTLRDRMEEKMNEALSCIDATFHAINDLKELKKTKKLPENLLPPEDFSFRTIQSPRWRTEFQFALPDLDQIHSLFGITDLCSLILDYTEICHPKTGESLYWDVISETRKLKKSWQLSILGKRNRSVTINKEYGYTRFATPTIEKVLQAFANPNFETLSKVGIRKKETYSVSFLKKDACISYLKLFKTHVWGIQNSTNQLNQALGRNTFPLSST